MVKLRRQTTDNYKNLVGTQLYRQKYDSESENFKLAVLASSSEGNASILNNRIQIDHGLFSKNLGNEIMDRGLDDGKKDNKWTLLLTHHHKDHTFAHSILRNIVFDYNIYDDIYGTQEAIDKIKNEISKHINNELDPSEPRWEHEFKNEIEYLQNIGWFNDHLHVITDGSKFSIYDYNNVTALYDVECIRVPHNVECLAFVITHIKTNKKYLHATDLSTTKTLPDYTFEHIAIENNHDVSSVSYRNWTPEMQETTKEHLDVEETISYILDHLELNGAYNELHCIKNANHLIKFKTLKKLVEWQKANRALLTTIDDNLDFTNSQYLTILRFIRDYPVLYNYDVQVTNNLKVRSTNNG